MLYAAIDIGTVTCRMLVARLGSAGTIEELCKEYAITNLGEGVDASGELKPEAIERTAQTVQRYCQVRDQVAQQQNEQVTTLAMATSAARDARNADDFVAALSKLGVQLLVIPGSEEAQLSFAGASCCFQGEDLLVSDIGGGSTELVLGCGGKAPVWSHSFNVGCRRVTEKFLHADPPSAQEFQAARAWVRNQLEGLFAQGCTQAPVPKRLVAVAGTATTVVAVRDSLAVYDSSKVHGQVVTKAQLDTVFNNLSSMTLAQRQQVVGLDPRRAPVILAGFLILQELLELAGMPSFTVSETDILQGMVMRAAQG